MWTRSCCASLPGLRNRFSQCPQTCTVVPVRARFTCALDLTTAAVLAAVLAVLDCHAIFFEVACSSLVCGTALGATLCRFLTADPDAAAPDIPDDTGRLDRGCFCRAGGMVMTVR